MARPAITIAEIISEYGAYYKNNGQNQDRIAQTLYRPFGSEEVCTVKRIDDTRYEAAEASVSELLQAYQKTWTPKGVLELKPNIINLDHFKLDFDIDVYDVTDTWADFLREEKLAPKDFPLVRYIIEKHLIPKIKDEMERLVFWAGVKGTITPGAATAAAAVTDGILTKLLAKIDAADISNISLDAITASNAFDMVEKFVEAIDDRFQATNMTLNMAHTLNRWYNNDKRNQFGYLGNDLNGSIDGSLLKTKPLASMAGSKAIWATPKSNIMSLWKAPQNAGIFNLQEDKRNLVVFTDFWWGVGFNFNEFIYAHIPAAEIPAP
jgi:hypothetical protein